jgi:hypothetical protein
MEWVRTGFMMCVLRIRETAVMVLGGEQRGCHGDSGEGDDWPKVQKWRWC